ncbi:MAG: hypothetical protein V1834_03075 [Candidatus Micrarchaeota archaeon]
MIQSIIILLISLFVLSKASHLVLDSSVKLSKFFGLSKLAIGFLLISIATSLPELMVSLLAAVQDNAAISVGNVLGSNITNITLVMGLVVLAHEFAVKDKAELLQLLKILFIASLLPLLLLIDFVARYASLFLLGVFAAYSLYILREEVIFEESGLVHPRDAVFAGMTFGASVVILLLSAHFVVSSAVDVAFGLGLSQAAIAATLIALGTSLPEVSVGIQAARRGETGIVAGTVLGSCIVNLTLVLGLASLARPVVANLIVFANLLLFLLIANFVLWILLLYRRKLGWHEGLVLIGVYALFVLSTSWLTLGL